MQNTRFDFYACYKRTGKDIVSLNISNKNKLWCLAHMMTPKEARVFSCDEAVSELLLLQKSYKISVNRRLWRAIHVARTYVAGDISSKQLIEARNDMESFVTTTIKRADITEIKEGATSNRTLKTRIRAVCALIAFSTLWVCAANAVMALMMTRTDCSNHPKREPPETQLNKLVNAIDVI